MDDRRFDSFVRSLAEGKSRRSVLKGLIGLGGAALVGSATLDRDTDAARRPTPTPTPIRCPGRQQPVGGVCTCPPDAPEECGPDCCTKGAIPVNNPGYSECCDNACCFGTCLPEEGCCPTNNRPGGLPPLAQVCATTNECCPAPNECCTADGCCDTFCTGPEGADFCCPQASVCPSGGSTQDTCCLFGTTCCGAGTNQNVCIDLTVEGNCCDDGDCGDPCQVCNLETRTCGPRCDEATQVCCTEQAGPGVCVTGNCCLGAPCTTASDDDDDDDGICCQTPSGTVCVDGETCPTPCSEGNPCTGCATCVRGLCVQGCAEGTICCDEECLSSSEFFTCPVDAAGCCAVSDACCEVDGCCSGACYGGDSNRDLCCDAATNVYCALPNGTAQCCPDQVNQKCCGTRGCCGNSQCNEEADVCCPSDAFACGLTEGNQCCDTDTQKCCEGVCIPASECCPANGDVCPTCEPNCLCGDGVVDPNTDGLACNGGLAAGGGVCACGWCVVPLEGCPCGCAGDTECVQCAGDGVCATYNQGLSCNGGAGICQNEWCVDAPPPSCEPNCDCSIPANDGLACNGGGGPVCGCGSCVIPLGDCLCGCDGDTECIACEGGQCVLINQGVSCNTGAGVCIGAYCDVCLGLGGACGVDGQCCTGLCDQGACVNCKLPGGTCDAPGDCCSGICSGGFCLAP